MEKEMTRYQKYKASYVKYRLKNKGRFKSNPEAVKRWKQANPERVLELNRKSYAKAGRKRKSNKIETASKLKMCACGNVAFKMSNDGPVCERCNRIERKNRIYENNTIIFTSSSNGLHISNP